jgi:WD40 repeat protein
MNTHRSHAPWFLLPLITAPLVLACSANGIERRPFAEPPAPPDPPALVDLWAPPDPAVAGNRFCGTIGSSGIRALVALGGDGSFAVAYGSGQIVLHDVGRPAAIRTLTAHGRPIRDLDVTADGKLLLSTDETGEVKLWRLTDGELLRVVREAGVFTAAITSDGSHLALLSIRTLEVQTLDGAPLWQATDELGGGRVAFSADGETVMSGGESLTFRRVKDGQLVRNLGGPFGLRGISPDLSRFLVWRSRPNSFGVVDGTTGTLVWSAMVDGDVFAAAFTQDSGQVVVASGDRVKVLRATDGTEIRGWPVSDGEPSAVAFAADGSRVALGLKQGGFRVWDLESGELVVKEIALPGHVLPATDVAFSPDGSLMGSMSGDPPTRDSSLKVWRTSDAALLYTYDANPTHHHPGTFAFSPDSRTIALTTNSQVDQVHLIGALDGSLRGTIEQAGVSSLTFSPDGSRLVGRGFCMGCKPEALSVWRLADGQPEPGFGDPDPHDGYAVTFSRDGSLIAATARGNRIFPADGLIPPGGALVAVWRVADRQLLWTRPAERNEAARSAFSPDGTQLAVASGKANLVRIHSSQDGTVLRELAVPGAQAVAFAPSGELATAGDTAVRLWRVADGQPIAEATGSFTRVAFASDGQRLVAAGRDGSLHLLCRFGPPAP